MKYAAFESLEEAEVFLKNAVNEILRGDIAEAVKRKEAEMADSVVYSYPVKDYERRFSFSNVSMYGSVPSDLMVTITSLATPNDYTHPFCYRATGRAATTNKDLPLVIETGVGYDFIEMEPRPLKRETVAALLGSGELLKIMRAGLNARGVAVRR